MAQYSNWRLTQYGQRRLLGTVGAGTVNPETSTTGTNIEIRGLSIGTGYDASTINPEEYYETRKSLRDPIHTYSVLNYYGDKVATNGVTRVAQLEFIISNRNEIDRTTSLFTGSANTRINVNELGIMVLDPETNSEVLFAYQVLKEGTPLELMPYDNTNPGSLINIRYLVNLAITEYAKITISYGGNDNYLTVQNGDNRYTLAATGNKLKEDVEILNNDKIGRTEFKKYKTTTDNSINGINTRITDDIMPSIQNLNDSTRTMSDSIRDHGILLGNHTEDITNLKEKTKDMVKLVKKEDILPKTIFDEYDISNNTLGNENMMYIFRALNTLSKTVAKALYKDDIRVMSRDMYHNLIGLTDTRSKDVKLVVYTGNTNGDIQSGERLEKTTNIEGIYDGIADLKTAQGFGNKYTQLSQSSTGFIVTFKFYRDKDGRQEISSYSTTYVQKESNANIYDVIFKYLYKYTINPLSNNTIIAGKIARINIIFSDVVHVSKLPTNDGELNDMVDDNVYINIPKYISLDRPVKARVIEPYRYNDNNINDLVHLSARLPKILVLTKQSDVTLNTDDIETIVTKMVTTQDVDKDVLFNVLGSVKFIKYAYSRMIQYNKPHINDSKEMIKTNLAKSIFEILVNEYYVRGYKIPTLEKITEFVNVENRIVLDGIDMHNDDPNRIPNREEVKTTYMLNGDTYLNSGAHIDVYDSTNYTHIDPAWRNTTLYNSISALIAPVSPVSTIDNLEYRTLAKDTINFMTVNKGEGV